MIELARHWFLADWHWAFAAGLLAVLLLLGLGAALDFLGEMLL